MSFEINSKTFWTGVGGVIGYTIAQRTWPYYNGNGEEVSQVVVNCMRGVFSIASAVGFRKHSIAPNMPVSFNEVVIGVSAIALTYFSTQYLYPAPDIFLLGKTGS